jgi:hypothetical protein
VIVNEVDQRARARDAERRQLGSDSVRHRVDGAALAERIDERAPQREGERAVEAGVDVAPVRRPRALVEHLGDRVQARARAAHRRKPVIAEVGRCDVACGVHPNSVYRKSTHPSGGERVARGRRGG